MRDRIGEFEQRGVKILTLAPDTVENARAYFEKNDLPFPALADTPALGTDGIVDFGWSPPKLAAKASGPVNLPIKDFYLTNAICRASPTMRRCSEELLHGVEFSEAAE